MPTLQSKWCPRCHREVKLPEWAGKANIKGKMIINCGNCKIGKVIIKGTE